MSILNLRWNMRCCILITFIFLMTIRGFSADESEIFAERPEIYFRFPIQSRAEISTITRIVSIDNVVDDTVYAYANRSEFDRFKALQKSYEILTPPALMRKIKMSDRAIKSYGWDSYPTYPVYRDMMYRFATDYPAICRIDSIGASVKGRGIFFAVISDNVQSEEAEPEVMYTATMHGDETTGYILMLRLVDYLLSNYAIDKQVTSLVDHLEIWINPLANPDGTYFSGDSTVLGATRSNANGVDLNRNFPDPEQGEHPDGNAWQPETIAMMELAERQNFVLSANFHSGAELLNYPWDCKQTRHADDDWLIRLCRQYADTVHAYAPTGYMDYLDDGDFEDGIINGYEWYEIHGGRQDYMTYYRHGREVTIEISDIKMPAAADIGLYWEYNRAALLNYLAAALSGIRGEIRADDLSTLRISIVGHEEDNSWAVPDRDFGDFYRLCLPGVYSLQITDGAAAVLFETVGVRESQAPRIHTIIGAAIPGDVNADGSLDVADVVLIRNYIDGRLQPDGEAAEAADWNGDGIIDRADLERILQFLEYLVP